MKTFLILFFAIINISNASMYIKVSGTKIMGHDYKSHDEYNIEIPNTDLINKKGQYIYDWSGSELVSLNKSQIDFHPLTMRNKMREQMAREKKINNASVESKMIEILDRLRPGVSFSIQNAGNGRSLYQRLIMVGKPTKEELQVELDSYKNELRNTAK